jgi:enoyl-CoA hydratase/carnithine racemase
MPAELLTSRHHATLILTLSGSSASSLLQANIHAAIVETLSTAETDRSLAMVVLTGLEHFIPTEGKPGSAAPLSESALEYLGDWIDTLQTFPKPVIAAVEGQVTGAGLSLMLACDLVVANQNSGFSASPPMLGGASWFLNRRLPYQLAMEILLADRPIPADRLHALGLINQLVEEGKAIHSAMEWAEQIAKGTGRVEGIKTLLLQAAHNSLSQQLAAETQYRMEN